MRINSYETLFDTWIELKDVAKLVMVGKNLRSDKEGFLFDDPSALILQAAESKDVLSFLSILLCYEPCELEDMKIPQLDDKLLSIVEEYKDAHFNAVQKEISGMIFPQTESPLLF